MLLPLPHLQVKGAEKVLFGLDDIVGMSDIVVVEGEMDKLALEEAGYTNVVSVRTCLPGCKHAGLPALPPCNASGYSNCKLLWRR
jgi:hypothetical protein